MRIVFMGTPKFAADILKALIDDELCDVVAAYTMPDAVRGRGKKLVPSDVKKVAIDNKIPVVELKSFKSVSDVENLKAYSPDFICVAAFGALLPKSVLDIPKYECLNVHASLLPKWRGAAPVHRAILNGDEFCGTSIMKMEEGLDTGDFCKQTSVEVGTKAVDALLDELAICGSVDLIESMKNIANGSVKWISQNDEDAVYAPKLNKRELWISPKENKGSILKKIQAADKSHSAKCQIGKRNVSVISALESVEDIECGASVLCNKILLLGCSDGSIEICEVQPDGKKIMEGASFAAGIQNIKNGDVCWSEIVD